MAIVHDDDDIVVVDKPVGVAAHPSVGLDRARRRRPGSPPPATASRRPGPASARASSSRLDVGTSGLMVVAKSEQALLACSSRRSRSRTVDKTYHALVQGLPDPLVGTIDAPIGAPPRPRLQVRGHGLAASTSVTHYEVLEAFRHASACSRSTWRPAGPTRSACTSRRCTIRAVGDLTYGADPKLAARLKLDRQWLHAVGLGFEHPGTGEYVHFESPYPEDLQRALDIVATF